MAWSNVPAGSAYFRDIRMLEGFAGRIRPEICGDISGESF